MVKTIKESKIEIWSVDYINKIETRTLEDSNAVILQVEPGDSDTNYIVEFIDPIYFEINNIHK